MSKNYQEDEVAETIQPKGGRQPLRESQNPRFDESDEEGKTANKSSFEYFTKNDLSDNSPGRGNKASHLVINGVQDSFNNNENSQEIFLPRQQNQSIREMPTFNQFQKFDTVKKESFPQIKKSLRQSVPDNSHVSFEPSGDHLGKRLSQHKQSDMNLLVVQSQDINSNQNEAGDGENTGNQSSRKIIDNLLPHIFVEPMDSEASNVVTEENSSSSEHHKKKKKDKKQKKKDKKRKKSKKKKKRYHSSDEESKSTHSIIQSTNGNPPPAPPQPESYIKWLSQQTGATGASIIDDEVEGDDEQMNFFEPLSFKKLQKVICSLHPVDPETKESFNISDRITVKDYYAKLSDICCCYALRQNIVKGTKFIRKKLGKGKLNTYPKPESMLDQPDTGSSSSEGDEDKGITKCSQSLGDGATLYLQMMKTFAIMFFLLTILNLPVYIIYEKNTSGNVLNKLDRFFKYFTIGNLGQMTTKCGFSDFDYKYFKKDSYSADATVDCGEGYIGELKEFGFLYKEDKVYGGESDGSATCKHIEEPMDYYKKPQIIPIVCNEEETDDVVEYQICLIDQKFQRKEITEPEMIAEKDLLTQNSQRRLNDNYLLKMLGDYKFQNNDATESGEEDDTSYAWFSDPNCDQTELFWNTKDQNKFKITPEWEYDSEFPDVKEKLLSFIFEESEDSVSPPYTKATVIYDEHGENQIASIIMTSLGQGDADGSIDEAAIEGESVLDDNVEAGIDEEEATLDDNPALQLDEQLHFVVVDEFTSEFDYEQDQCQQNLTDNGYFTSSAYYTHSSLWIFDGDFPETPKIDQEITFTNIDPECRYQNTTNAARVKKQNIFKDKVSFKKFTEYFEENCYYQQKCVINPWAMGFQIGDEKDGEIITEKDMGLFGLISDECKLRMSDPRYQDILSKNYIGIFGCKYDDVGIPFTDTRLHKEVIGVFIVCLDFSTILVMMFFFAKINSLNNEFLANMDDLRVQMKDFGVKIDNVKLDRYTQDSRVVKLKIWQHFKEILEPKKDKLNDMQCIDVCLSIYTQPSIQCVFRMQEIQLDINRINNKLMTNQYSQSEIPDKQDALKDLYEKQKRFEARYKQLVQKKVHKEGDNLTVKRIQKSQRIKQIQYIFVVFKNCDTGGEVLKMYKKEQLAIQIIKNIFPSNRKEKKQVKQLFGRNLDVKAILEPDEIIWQNLAFTGDEQRARKYAISIISVFFLLFNTLFTMYLGGFKVLMNKKIPSAVGCPDTSIDKVDAYKDYLKSTDGDDQTKSAGLLACYCQEETSLWLPWTLIGHSFQEFSEFNPNQEKDTKNYCLQWWALNWFKEISLFFVSTSAVFINEFVADFFQTMGEFQKKHTKIEEQITCFKQIFTQEFINMGIIVLITSFDQLGITNSLLGDMSSNANVYKEFEPSWYMDYGNKICVFIFMSAFIVNSKDLIRFAVTVVYRCFDRKLKLNLKLDPEDEDDDTPNSRIRIQSDLEKLYKGKIFKGEKAYSRMMSTMYVVQMYSSGMPILYLNGFVFYFVTFWVNKFLLIFYYQKSRTLTRTIPLFTMEYLKYGLLLHMIMACFMLTNKKSFITKTMTLGVTPIFDAEKRHDRLITEGTLSEDKAEKAEILIDRYRFAHQQLLFGFMIFWVLFYFVGRTMFAVIGVLIENSWKLIQKSFKTFLEYTQQQIELKKSKKASQIHTTNQAVKGNLLEMVAAKKQQIIEKAEEEERLEDLAQAQEYAEQSDQSSRDRVRAEHLMEELEEMQEEQEQEEAIIQEQNNKIQLLIDGERSPSEILNAQDEEEYQKELKKQIQQKRFERPDYSDNIIGEMTTENLSNFYERCKREQEDFWDIFQTQEEISRDIIKRETEGPFKTLFLETLYTYRIAPDQCFEYQDFLQQRIIDIEMVIDKYFTLLQPTIIKKMKAGFERDKNRRKKDNKEGSLKDQVTQRKYEEWFIKFSDEVQFSNKKFYPQNKKMKLLVEFQDELIQADINRKENRQGIRDICRMTGSLSQSYFIFDAQQYKVGRKIYYGLEQEQDVVEDDLNDLLGEQQEQQEGVLSGRKKNDGGLSHRSVDEQSDVSRYTNAKQKYDQKRIADHLSAVSKSDRRKESTNNKQH